jgi:hypothetical protein
MVRMATLRGVTDYVVNLLVQSCFSDTHIRLRRLEMKMKSLFRVLLIMLFSVAAQAATYYVSGYGDGSDSDNGTTPATAWATVKKVTLNEATSDIVYFAGTFDTESDSNDCIAYLVTAGGNAGIHWHGCYDLNDVNDGGQATFDGTGLGACVRYNGTGDIDERTFSHITFSNATTLFNATASDNVTFDNCRFSTCTTGATLDDGILLHRCLFDNCTTTGFTGDTNIRVSDSVFWRTTGGTGLSIENGAVTGCLFADNSTALYMSSVGTNYYTAAVHDCIIDGNNTGNGYRLNITAAGINTSVTDCIFYDCTNGIDNVGTNYNRQIAANIVYYSNNANTSKFEDANDTLTHAYNKGIYTASSDPFGSDPGNLVLATALASYDLSASEYPTGASKAGGDLGNVMAYWADIAGSTNPPSNAEAPRLNKDPGGKQSTDAAASATAKCSPSKDGGKQ